MQTNQDKPKIKPRKERRRGQKCNLEHFEKIQTDLTLCPDGKAACSVTKYPRKYF